MLQEFNNLKDGRKEVRLRALTSILKNCSNAAGNADARKSFDYALTRFVKGLQSQVTSTKEEFYTGLVALLRLIPRVGTEEIVDGIGKTLMGSGGDSSKAEKRLRGVGTILAHGAVIRARFTSAEKFDVEVGIKILNNLVDAVEKKKAFVSLASPFVTSFISLYPVGTLSDQVVLALRSFLHKSEGGTYDADQIKLILTAERRGLLPSLGSVDTVEELVTSLKEGDPNDTELISLVFEYARKKGWEEEFWTTFIANVGPYDFHLFCTCISESVKAGGSLRFLLTEEIVKLGLSVFHKKDLGKEAKERALQAFKALLTWKVDQCDLTPKERKKALRILYKKTPNLLYEYQVLCGVIRTHLDYLNEKELEHLKNFVTPTLLSNSEEKSIRGRLSSLALLSVISALKQSTSELRAEITKIFFQLGFCKLKSQGAKTEEEDPGAENIQQQAVSHFVSSLVSTADTESVTNVHAYVKSVIDDSDETHQLRVPLAQEVLTLWKRGNKSLKKSADKVVTLITAVGALQLIADAQHVSSVYEDWLDLVKKSKNEDPSESIIVYIVDQVIGMERPFFSVDAIFKRFAMDEKVTETAIQSLADAIEPGDDFDDDDDEDDEDESDDEVGVEVNTGMTNGKQPNGELYSTSAASKAALQNGDASDSDATIDMDEATEEDLKKMDQALAAVFSAKKLARDEIKLEGVRYMRVLNLVDTLLDRFKEPPISAILILLMPLVSSVKHSLSAKSKETSLDRTLKTLKRLNRFKKFSGMDQVESDVLSTMAEEIRVLIKKKGVPSGVKEVLSSSMKNLLGTSSIGEEKSMESGANGKSTKSKKRTKNKKKKGETPSSVTKNLPSSVPVEAEGNNKKSKKKKRKNRPENTEESNSDKGPLPLKRKAQSALLDKKKAKHMRLQVLSEGLSNNVE